MKRSMQILAILGLIGFGYLLGSTQGFKAVWAQTEESMPSDDAIKKIREAYAAMKNAASQLSLESRYSSVTHAVNPFSILVGGINVKDDLEDERGVDPETFAALNVSIFEIKKNKAKNDMLADWVDVNLFNYDSSGRLTYRNKVLRVYSISRLRRLNAQRQIVLEDAREAARE